MSQKKPFKNVKSIIGIDLEHVSCQSQYKTFAIMVINKTYSPGSKLCMNVVCMVNP